MCADGNVRFEKYLGISAVASSNLSTVTTLKIVTENSRPLGNWGRRHILMPKRRRDDAYFLICPCQSHRYRLLTLSPYFGWRQLAGKQFDNDREATCVSYPCGLSSS
jgi:hypothetical protein